MNDQLVDISVPCASCGAPVGFGARACAACGKKLPSALRKALEARLEAASVEYHDLRNNQGIATATLLVLGGMHIVMGVFLYVMSVRSDLAPTAASDVEAVATLVVNATIGVVLLACGAWSRASPVIAISTAFALWLVTRLLAGSVLFDVPFISPQALIRDILGRLFVVVVLLRGLYSALKARALERQLLRRA